MKKNNQKGVLKLPQQVLAWNAIPSGTSKVVLQFELNRYANGNKRFGIVAYPGKKVGKKWVYGEKIQLAPKKGSRLIKLPIPITLGNLEVNCDELKQMNLDKTSQLLFTPKFFKSNPHASYEISLEGDTTASSGTAFANPSPPARPAAD